MAHLYSIQDLTPRALSEVSVGSVLTMLDNDQTLYVRVDLTSPTGGGTFIALDSTLTVAQVSTMNMGKMAQCLPPGVLRVSVDALGGRSNDLKPGQMILSKEGPVLGVQRRDQMGFTENQYVSMNTWQFVDFPAGCWTVTGAKLVWCPTDSAQGQTLLFSF